MNKEKIFVFDNSIYYIFYCFRRFVIGKVCIFCCGLTGAKVDSDNLMVFLLSHCQMTARNYILVFLFMEFIQNCSFVQRLINKLSGLDNGRNYSV